MVDHRHRNCRVPKGYKRVGNFWHKTILSKNRFDKRSFRTKQVKRGVLVTIGCPKGNYSVKKKRCKVGTRIQRMMKAIPKRCLQ